MISNPNTTLCKAAIDLLAARDSLLNSYWAESEFYTNFHYAAALKSLATAAETLGYTLVKSSKEEAA
jgi:hypothetical protein